MTTKWQTLTPKNPYVIAEVGSNWEDLSDCLISITRAKIAGASAVKFQLYDDLALYGYIDKFNLTSHCLPVEWLPKIKEACDKSKIDLVVSSFSPALALIADEYADVHKVASAEALHLRLLQQLKSCKKPVIISSGGKSLDDISWANDQVGGDAAILYCVAEYPARTLSEYQFAQIKDRFEVVGFSDHTTDVAVIPKRFRDLGASIFEKHVNFAQVDSPDAGHSINEWEFREMCNVLRNNDHPITVFEAEMVQIHSRRLIVIKTMGEGEKFKEGVNFGIYRGKGIPTAGIDPRQVEDVEGKTATRTMHLGDTIERNDFY